MSERYCPECDGFLEFGMKKDRKGVREGFFCPDCDQFYDKDVLDPPEFTPLYFQRYLSEVRHLDKIPYCDFGDAQQAEIHAVVPVGAYDPRYEKNLTEHYLFQTSLENFSDHGGFEPIHEIRLTPRLLKILQGLEFINKG